MISFHTEGVKKLWSYLICIGMLLLFSNRLTGQDFPDPYKYPKLEEIAKIFAQNFELNNYRNEDFYRFNFVRDPSGWHVTPQYLSYQNPNRITIWSYENKFPPHIDPHKNQKNILVTELISNRDLYDFSIHPYYGYSGWMDDVIKYYEQRKTATLSDNELYGLGRAYAQKASDIFWSHSQYSNPTKARGVRAEKRDARLYLQYAEKSSYYLHILYERSPDYRTLVGLMDIKYANEVMDSFYELQIFGFEKEAGKFLESAGLDQLYHEFWERYAYEILSPLEKNSILFTNGDNDTYPLIWLQESKGFRKDIKIINLSLLHDPLYYLLLTRKKNAEQSLENILDEKKIIVSLSERTLLTEDKTARNLLFKNVQISIARQIKENNPVITIPHGNYIIDYVTDEGLVDTLKMTSGKKGNVISTSEYLLQNIIHSQIGKRRLYFSKGMQPRYKSMFEKTHLVDKGLYYSLEQKGPNTIFFENHYFDTLAINDLVENSSLNAPGSEFFSRTIIFNLLLEARFIQIYTAEFQGDNKRKHKLILEFIEKYPPQKTGINYYYLFLIDNLFNTEETEELGKKAFNEYFGELEKNILKTELKDDNPGDIQTLKYYKSILSLVKMSSFFEQEEHLKDDISFLEKTIERRLLEFPEIQFY